MSRGWSMASLWEEAVRNLRASLPRTVTLGVIAGGLAFAVVAAEAASIADMASFRRRLVDEGGNVVIAGSDFGIPAALCEAVGDQEHVIEAGSSTSGTAIYPNVSPGRLFGLAGATAGAVRIWAPGTSIADLVGPGWVLGSEAAESLGSGAGSFIGIDGGVGEVMMVLPDSRRLVWNSGSIMHLMAPEGDFDSCWIEYDDSAGRIGPDLARYALGDAPGEVRAARLVKLDEFSRDVSAEFRARPTARLWLAVGLGLFLILVLLTWTRRSEFALYRALGARPIDVMVLGVAESGLVVVLATVVGFLWGLAWFAVSQGEPVTGELVRVVGRTVSSGLLAALALAPLAMPIVMRRDGLMDQLKERA